MTVDGCAFCAILRGEEEAEVAYETTDFIALFPINPATLGHTLVIPRIHVPDVWSLDPTLVGPLFETAVRVGAAISSALTPEGMNLIHSAGRAATQTIFHLHVHLVPRWDRDSVEDFWPPPEASPPEWQQDDALVAIKRELGRTRR